MLTTHLNDYRTFIELINLPHEISVKTELNPDYI